ncbi:hypothetical protein [Streptomyces sp. NPDC047071]|uniref:hypothetical protein n=1 Tax=Streptomyces sp. NPDC047071 TaxID=3154808 RepID=UPI003451BD7D
MRSLCPASTARRTSAIVPRGTSSVPSLRESRSVFGSTRNRRAASPAESRWLSGSASTAFRMAEASAEPRPNTCSPRTARLGAAGVAPTTTTLEVTRPAVPGQPVELEGTAVA